MATSLAIFTYDCCYLNNDDPFHLCWKKGLINYEKVPEYHGYDCSLFFRILDLNFETWLLWLLFCAKDGEWRVEIWACKNACILSFLFFRICLITYLFIISSPLFHFHFCKVWFVKANDIFLGILIFHFGNQYWAISLE